MSDSKQQHAPSQDEVHEHQFRYFVIPAAIVSLVADNTISRGEAWLLGIIDSLVKTGGEGCWASNAWLAARCGIKKRQIQYDIDHLRELGLIVDSAHPKIVKGEPVRTIETLWSRDTERRTPSANGATPCNGVHTPMHSIARPPCTVLHPSNTEREKDPPNPQRGECDGDSVAIAPSPRTRRRAQTPNTLASIKIDTSSSSFAKRLRTLITTEMKVIISYSSRSWTKEFDRLRASLDGKEHLVDEILTWYEKNWSEVRMRVISAESFRTKFNKLIEVKEILAHKSKGDPRQDRTKQEGNDSCSNERLSDDDKEFLADLRWPNGEPYGLGAFYLRTKENAKRLHAISDEMGEDDEKGYLLAEFIYRAGGSWIALTQTWLKWVARSVKGWTDWGGSFKQKELQPDGKFFRDRLIAESKGVTSSINTPDKLINALKDRWA